MKSRVLLLSLALLALLSFSACGGVSMGTSTTTTQPTYTVSAAVSGLTGSLVLQDNTGNNMTITTNATFAFSPQIASGGSYSVAVVTQPSGQTCLPGSNASGTISGNVTVTVTCSTNVIPTYTVSAAVSGLTGTLVLQDNSGNNMTITTNGTFAFSPQIASGGSYDVAVVTQPSGQACSVGSNASGTVSADVTVAVTCTTTVVPMYTVSAAVSGLSGTVVLQDLVSGVENSLTVTANGTFPFTTQVPSGGTYAVTVLTQPSGETCTVGSNASGTATGNVTVAVTCSAILYTVSAAVSGLSGTVVLQDLVSGVENSLTVTANGTFPFTTQIPSGGTYAVTVLTQPSGQTCTLGSNASGTATGNVTVAVTCSATLYTISAAVSGLSGTVVLQDNGGNNLTVTTNGTFPFTTQIASGGSYAVTILTQPSGQTCTLGSNASGTATGNVTVAVTCSATLYTISAAVSGLTGTVVLQDNGGNNLTITTNGTFPFTTQIPSGGTYAVTVLTQPSGQTCTLGSNASGAATANVTVAVTCTTATLFTVSAAVSGLTGTLVLQDNPGNNMTITTNGTFAFSPQIPSGGSYDVAVVTQPSGQTCTPGSNASGTLTGNVTVNVTCTAAAVGGTWTWESGSSSTSQTGNYPPATSKKQFLPGIFPGSRYGAFTWTDGSGNLWMFGGNGNDSQGNEDVLNDLWEYSPSLNEWSWVGGSNTVDQNGVYGTLGSPGGTNIPGGRAYGASWKDESGNFWLFGGYGLDSVSTDAGGALNDLWEFNTSTAQWTWWGPNASLTINQNGLYGTKGTTGTGNYPGGRYWPSAATDGLGNFWLFGGDGYDATGSQGNPEALNDLWVYSTTSQQWTWISGSNMFGQAPTYGAQGSGNASNVPGARDGSVGWMDSSGDFWLFGGVGIDSQLTYGYLNDTWQYIPSSKEWVWEGPSGSNVRNQPGNYVAIGQAGTPGNREWPSGWLDSSGNFWLFGGQQDGGEGLNDLWEFSANNWTWEGGSSSSNQLGNYPSGGVGNTGTPGARWNSASWIDLTGNLWLFGGEGAAAAYPIGDLNDLWKFVP